jgi:RNA polymerase sigma factor (TIGR02999 family)
MSAVPVILDRVQHGDPQAAAELPPLVYEGLRKLATAKMSRETAGHTLQPTALVHEAWLRLAGDAGQAQSQNRAHFFGAAAEAMRRILIEHARRRLAAKRGNRAAPLEVDELEMPSPAADDDTLLAVNGALEKFNAVDPRKAELVKLCYFVGLSFEETAAALGIAGRAAKQWWACARAWLNVQMRGPAER